LSLPSQKRSKDLSFDEKINKIQRGLTPFIGRERELELLIDAFERSKTGIVQAFSIVSNAGLGKSRLLYEFRKIIPKKM
jgi:hypothetical protein